MLTPNYFEFLRSPKINLKSHVTQQLRVTPGTMTRSIYEAIPFALDFRVYILNITNPDEVTAGGKPILEEIGPYHFEYVLKQNENLNRNNHFFAKFHVIL